MTLPQCTGVSGKIGEGGQFLISPWRVEKIIFYPCLATALMSFQIRFNDTERKAHFTPVTCVQKSGLGIFI